MGRVYPTRYDIPLVLVYRRYIFPVFIGQAKERIERQTYLPEGFPPGCHLVLLGFLYNGFLQLNFPDVRLASVLGRIGLAWMLGAFIYMSLKKSVQYGLIVFILVGYWLLLAFVPAPDAAGLPSFYRRESGRIYRSALFAGEIDIR